MKHLFTVVVSFSNYFIELKAKLTCLKIFQNSIRWISSLSSTNILFMIRFYVYIVHLDHFIQTFLNQSKLITYSKPTIIINLEIMLHSYCFVVLYERIDMSGYEKFFLFSNYLNELACVCFEKFSTFLAHVLYFLTQSILRQFRYSSLLEESSCICVCSVSDAMAAI